MAPKEPTKHQLSSRLHYEQNTPAFLQKLQRRIAGDVDEDDEDEYYDDGSGRPPIPQRPTIPERPDDDPGSANGDEGDEKPQIVREAENERRKEKGLPPILEPVDSPGNDAQIAPPDKAKSKEKAPSLSFSSSRGGMKSSKLSTGKRKVIGDTDSESKD
ncbi:hypothetical protein SERLADRAFT_468799, partial [Serpula lacrymans var. lacrymans S7.9]